MSNLQLIEALCGLVEEEAAIIERLYSRLDQISAVTESDRESIAHIEKRFSDILGHDEVPDFLAY